MHNFKKLHVYVRSLEFTKVVRHQSSMLPKDELFGLISQFRRASYSVVLNIAEGAGNASSKEFSRFLLVALRSCYECLGCIDIARANWLLKEVELLKMEHEVNEIASMIVGVRRSLKS